MSNKNDMKLIMEEWRKTISEITLDQLQDPEAASNIAQNIGKSNNTEKLAKILPASNDTMGAVF